MQQVCGTGIWMQHKLAKKLESPVSELVLFPNRSSINKIFYLLVAPLHRLWWHFHSYTTVIGVMLLLLLSLMILYVHNQLKQVFLELHD
jgi:hypothetical protein